jgi:ABC-type polysaccharide/polyol phosphate export permease
MSWQGDFRFLYKQLILKDFRIRYRNMSLGVFWSLLNPLVMMGVLTFIFTQIFPSRVEKFPLFVLCGIIPFNFFATSWLAGTVSITSNVGLIKRLGVPREAVTLSTVLSCCPHLLIQLVLLALIAFLLGVHPNVHWVWLSVVWGMEIVFVCGLALLFAGLNVFVQDTRYFVESATTVLFWMVPIFYDLKDIPHRYADLYQYNPVAAIILAMRNILIENKAPSWTLLSKLAIVSTLALIVGMAAFRKLQPRFYERL